jgi:hypothetical protein
MKKISIVFLICLTAFFVQAQELYRDATGKYGYKDTKGNIVIQPKYDKAEAFSNGLAAVNIGAKYNEDGEAIKEGKWGYIDSNGKEVVAPKYDLVESFDRYGFAVVINSYEDTTLHLKYGVIDQTGKEVVPLKYNYIDDWGIVQMQTPQGVKKGYLDPTSYKEIIPTIYDDIHLYQCGIATVMLNGKYGFVDQLTGKELVPPKYDTDQNNSFSEGLAKVSLNEKYFYIDKYGNEFDADDYYSSYPIRGYTFVQLKSQSFFVDSTGKKYSMNKNVGRCYDIFENVA